MLKMILKAAGVVLLALIIVLGGYVGYVFISYHRLPDMDAEVEMTGDSAAPGRTYTVAAWNLGFGAYSADYSFFMDGGTESRAYSKQAVLDNLTHANTLLASLKPDFILLQELDTDADRSYHVNEVNYVTASQSVFRSYYAQNYDSPYLFYPVTKPHGASKAGLLTLTKTGFDRTARRSLPVESGLRKILDLDRCYSKVWVPVENGRYLVLFNTHLSADTSDGGITDEQLAMLTADMLAEYEAGNYAVCGGDFNKDLPGNSPEVFGVSGENYSWAQPMKDGAIPAGLTLVNSLDAANPLPSCRNADKPYVPGQSFVLITDGFIVSDNVAVKSCRVIDDGFACSDHNPVVMAFELTE